MPLYVTSGGYEVSSPHATDRVVICKGGTVIFGIELGGIDVKMIAAGSIEIVAGGSIRMTAGSNIEARAVGDLRLSSGSSTRVRPRGRWTVDVPTGATVAAGDVDIKAETDIVFKSKKILQN